MNQIVILTLGLSLAPVVCWAAPPTADEAKAIAEIKNLGGGVEVDENRPDKPVTIDLRGSRATDAGLENLKALSRLQTLNLLRTNITDAGLEHLTGLTELRYLGLSNTKVTAAGRRWIQEALPMCSLTNTTAAKAKAP
jgi:hypothetical protein